MRHATCDMKNYSSKLKTSYFLFVICHLSFVIYLSFVICHLSFAQESTPSAEEKILEAVRERIQEKQLTIERKAYVGNLKSIANSTLTLETKNGIKQVRVSSESAVIRINEKTRKEVKFEDLTITEFTIAMGYVGENEVLEATRLIINKEPKEEQKRDAIYGLVEEVDFKKEIIKIKEFKKEKNWDLEITKKTEITKKAENETEEIKLEEIKAGNRLVAIGTSEEENVLTTQRIHILP